MGKTLRVIVGIVALLAVNAGAGPARASYPGTNGRIAYLGTRGVIYTVTSTGTGRRQITAAGNNTPTWSPDGKRIAFVRHVDVYTVGANGGPITQVTTSTANESEPSWSPDGKYLVFESDRNGATNLYKLRSTAPYGTAVNITGAVAPCGYAADPTWGTGGYIAFYSCDSRSSSDRAIYEIKPDGTGLRKLMTCTLGCGWLDWSPKGRAIAYSDGFVVYQYTPSTNTTKQVSQSVAGLDCYDPAWSPAGTQIIYVCNSTIWVASPTGLNRHPLLSPGYAPNWQPVPSP
ncbi:MAG TPA: hypothetical protein VFH74_10560 [Gaiellales bacterium]|nr:hypothetical protein [Gaiellales bacterium]